MITDQTKIITDYIAVWGWHLLAWMFFLKSLGFLVVKEYIWFISLIILFVTCETIAMKRKIKVENAR